MMPPLGMVARAFARVVSAGTRIVVAAGSARAARRAATAAKTGHDLGRASVLDFGCGYGRVARVLARHVPRRHLTVFDVDPEASGFCAREFAGRGLAFAGEWDWAQVPFERYDCIWAG